jgi:ubiquinone/menaquinone biosynthesis C-methylase UbiE
MGKMKSSRKEKVREVLRHVPGAVPAYAGAQKLYFATAEALGLVPNKHFLVSRNYWDRRAIKQWERDRVPDTTYQEAAQEVITELKNLSWNSLLEVGCGYGRVLKAIAEAMPGKRLWGGDFSFNQLAHARDYLNGSEINILQLDAQRLPFVDGYFDVIITSAALIYLHPKELVTALREFHRVTRRYVVLSEYAMDHLTSAAHKRLARGAPFYMHDYSASLAKQGFTIHKTELMNAWYDQPERLPETLLIAERSGAR